MDLYEYQAKDLFAAHGVPEVLGPTAEDADAAAAVATELGTAVVVKAQVKTSRNPDSVSMENITPDEEISERTIFITPIDRDTLNWSKPWSTGNEWRDQ